MKTQNVRRSILCLCDGCHKGRVYVNGVERPCLTCHGRGEVLRWIIEVVTVEDEQERVTATA